MLHMLDTNIVSYLLKGKAPQIEHELMKLPPSLVSISVLTQAELLYGLKKINPSHHIHVAVHQLLKVIQIMPWDSEAAQYYADIRYHLTTHGNGIGEIDMMIAAHSLALGATLVTNYMRHFERVPFPLILKNWM